MFKINYSGTMRYGGFTEWNAFPIRHAVSFRAGGFSLMPYDSLNMGYNTGDNNKTVYRNRQRWCTATGFPADDIVAVRQVHGAHVVAVTVSDSGKGAAAWEDGLAEADGMITAESFVPLAIFTADCAAVFFYDSNRGVIGVAHAGWRSTVGGIVENMIKKMGECYHSAVSDIHCAVAPCIGVKAFEVGAAVAAHFPAEVVLSEETGNNQKQGTMHVDLERAVYLRLENAGIPSEQIVGAHMCTAANAELCYSYRRDHGTTGRMMNILMKVK